MTVLQSSSCCSLSIWTLRRAALWAKLHISTHSVFNINNLVVEKCFIFSLLLWWILVHLWILNSFGTHVMLKMFTFFLHECKTNTENHYKSASTEHSMYSMFFSCVIVVQCILCGVSNVLLYTGHTLHRFTQVILSPPYCCPGGGQIFHNSKVIRVKLISVSRCIQRCRILSYTGLKLLVWHLKR